MNKEVNLDALFLALMKNLYNNDYIPSTSSRAHVSKLSGVFSKSLKEVNVDITPEEIRTKYFSTIKS